MAQQLLTTPIHQMDFYVPKTTMPNLQQNAAEILKQGRHRLIRELPNSSAMQFMDNMAGLVDEYFRTSFETSAIGPRMDMARNPYAIIALGGYGRNDQCVHSDVDLLILFEKRVPDTAEGLIREIVYPLWDIGLDVGHATRSLKECLSLAGKDFEILTPLLDARFVCGMSRLYTSLTQQLRQKVILRRSRKIVDWLVETNQARHARFGDSAYLLEPNLKEGQGGLRDFHTMRWIACIRSGLKQVRDLEYMGLPLPRRIWTAERGPGLYRQRPQPSAHLKRSQIRPTAFRKPASPRQSFRL